MTTLLRRVPHMPGETVTSYASRLAACNEVDLATFCRHMGLRRFDIVAARRHTLDKLADLGGVDPEVLAWDAIVGQDGRRWSLRGQSLSPSTMRRRRPRFCPLCAAEDIGASGLTAREAAYGRSVWSVEPLRTCATHHVGLMDPIAVRGGSDGRNDNTVYDFVTTFGPVLGMLDGLRADLRRREPSAAERYLMQRLERGSEGSPWLDSLDFDVVAFLMEKLGAVAAFGRDVRYDGMSDEDLWFAGDVGFGLLEGGVDGLLRFCDMLQDTYQANGSAKEGPNSMYGRWWWSLNFERRGSEFEPVMAPLREHVLTKVAFEPGARVLGHVVERRRMHSVRSAAKEAGCRPSRLRHMLTAEGLLTPEQGRRRDALAVFDAELAAPLLATVGERMRSMEVMMLLGVKSLNPFMDEGLLVPLTASASRKQRLYEFSRAEVHRFHEAMVRRAPEVDVSGPGKVRLYDAVTVLKRGIGEMSRVIRDGKATATCRMRGTNGLADLFVDVGEMKRLLHERPYDGLPVTELHARLRTSSAVVSSLIERKAIAAETVTSGITRRSHRMVTFAELAKFEATYVFLFALAQERGCSPRRLRYDLKLLGIQPAFPPHEIGSSVYLRSVVG